MQALNVVSRVWHKSWSGDRQEAAMKRQTSKPAKTTTRPTSLKNLEPKKDAKGGDFSSRGGIGILKSTDGGRSW